MPCSIAVYGVLGQVSLVYPPVEGRSHTCYSPVRRSPPAGIATRRAAPRLACVKPVASVHPEPGSNSSLLYLVFFLFRIFLRTTPLLPGTDAAFIVYQVYLSRILTETVLLLVSLYYVVAKHFNDLSFRASAHVSARKRCKITTIFRTGKIFSGFFSEKCAFSRIFPDLPGFSAFRRPAAIGYDAM